MNKQEKLEQLKKEYELQVLKLSMEQAKVTESEFYPAIKAEYDLKVLEMEIEKAQEELKIAK